MSVKKSDVMCAYSAKHLGNNSTLSWLHNMA